MNTPLNIYRVTLPDGAWDHDCTVEALIVARNPDHARRLAAATLPGDQPASAWADAPVERVSKFTGRRSTGHVLLARDTFV